MADIVLQKNVGSLLSVRPGLALTALTAAGSGDNTAVNGIWLDRFALNMPLSAVFSTLFTAVLTATKTLSLTTTIQHSPDGGTTAVTFASETATVVATGPAGGGTVTGHHDIAVDLTAANRWIRINVTPDLSASGTDTAMIAAAVIAAGENLLPAA